MKICSRCSETHNKPGVYCSRKCANSREFTQESKDKKSLSSTNYYNNLPNNKKQEIINRLETTKLNRQGLMLSRLFETDFDCLSYQSKRKRVFIEQNFSCYA